MENKASAIQVRVRWMINQDLPAVLGVARAAAGPSLDEGLFRASLRQPHALSTLAEGLLGGNLFAKKRRVVLGFLTCLFREGETEARILHLVVHPLFRRRTIGTQLLQDLLRNLLCLGCQRVALDVRETSLGAQVFLRARGFRGKRVERTFFRDTGEDAFHMVRELSVEVPVS